MSSLRPMEAMDLFKFNSTNLDPLTETYGVDYYLGYVTKWPHLCRVMEDRNGKIEGYIIGKLESSPDYLPRKSESYLPWHAHITALTVAPASRRLGHAKRLTEALERVAEEANAYFVDLFVRAENTVAQKLYEGMGYSTFRTVVNYYNDGSDALDMRKPLKRDKQRKYVRENGREHRVDASQVWEWINKMEPEWIKKMEPEGKREDAPVPAARKNISHCQCGKLSEKSTGIVEKRP